MTRYEFGEILLIGFPQTGSAVRKKCPALVILDVGDDDVVLAPITSRRRSAAGDCQLAKWSPAGLLRPSWVRLAKIACLEKRGTVRRLGKLAAEDHRTVAERWQSLYAFSSPPTAPSSAGTS